MDIRKTGIIGYGSMGRMLLNKFAESGMFDRDSLFVANRTASKLEEAKDIARISTNKETASSCRIVFICVRPTELRAVLEEICPVISEDTLLVSLNGSIKFEQIRKIYKGKAAKVIPSVTAEINRSQTLICFNELADSEDREILLGLLGIIGNVIELPEAEPLLVRILVTATPFVSGLVVKITIPKSIIEAVAVKISFLYLNFIFPSYQLNACIRAGISCFFLDTTPRSTHA